MSFEDCSGYIELREERFAATLKYEDERFTLQVIEPSGRPMGEIPEEIELAHFRSNNAYFTLIGLFRSNHTARLGVGAIATYSVRLALEGALYTNRKDIVSDSWTVFIEDLAKIIHVTGLQHSMSFVDDDRFILNWSYQSPSPVKLTCTKSGVSIKLGQSMNTKGDMVAGPSIELRYPLTVNFVEALDLEDGLVVIHRVRLFFSLIMGKVLNSESLYFGLPEQEYSNVHVHGLLPVKRATKPIDPISIFSDIDVLANALDEWLIQFEEISEAIYLHMDGLEQLNLPSQLRFQLFVQALEALHRKTQPAVNEPLDTKPIMKSLAEHGVSEEITQRVGSMLDFAHEPGLKKRLKHFWDLSADEMQALRPKWKRKNFVDRVIATRNYYAHRTEKNSQVVSDSDLWDYTEALKAMSHIALLLQVNLPIQGVGQLMLRNRFSQFVISRTP